MRLDAQACVERRRSKARAQSLPAPPTHVAIAIVAAISGAIGSVVAVAVSGGWRVVTINSRRVIAVNRRPVVAVDWRIVAIGGRLRIAKVLHPQQLQPQADAGALARVKNASARGTPTKGLRILRSSSEVSGLRRYRSPPLPTHSVETLNAPVEFSGLHVHSRACEYAEPQTLPLGSDMSAKRMNATSNASAIGAATPRLSHHGQSPWTRSWAARNQKAGQREPEHRNERGEGREQAKGEHQLGCRLLVPVRRGGLRLGVRLRSTEQTPDTGHQHQGAERHQVAIRDRWHRSWRLHALAGRCASRRRRTRRRAA